MSKNLCLATKQTFKTLKVTSKAKESQIGCSGSEAYKNPNCRDSEVHPFKKETRQIQASRTGKYESIAHAKKKKLQL